jgi:DDE superfamily endonuclease
VIPEASAEFVCAMEDVLEVYARPYDVAYPVVCYDESPKQLVSEIRQSYMNAKGVVHEDCEYQREGAAEIVMIVEPLGQRREIFVETDHKGNTWANRIAYIAEQMYPNAKKITLVEDNLSSHKKYNLYNVFSPERARAIINKIDFVYTPKHGSWLNIAECELSVLSRQALNSRFSNKEVLEKRVKEWEKDRNTAQKGVDWQFKTADARTKLKRLYPTVLI